jgi:hypothetical protein
MKRILGCLTVFGLVFIVCLGSLGCRKEETTRSSKPTVVGGGRIPVDR